MITKEHSMTEEQAIKNKERFNFKREQIKEHSMTEELAIKNKVSKKIFKTSL
jgi:hypothetical protein